ncbi:MAG TPA: FAD-binding oxidoreductase [Nitrospiraceae bacterium]|nr:FAD-binding oxidoreductase [Nitrospiraceae bacterium]
MKRYESWGRYPRAGTVTAVPIYWRSDTLNFQKFQQSVLPFGQGRSYGDVCLNDGGILLDTGSLSHFIAFDETSGLIRCEAGVTLAEILSIVVPRGWFLPVTPGTKFVSVGGAIANDVHGKNHHRVGTFGMHVTQFELLRSREERVICSSTQNTDLFRATIGGLGLTGLILWGEIQLYPISSPLIRMERIRFDNLKEFFDIARSSDQGHTYTVAWIDCLAKNRHLGRGVFLRGNHVEDEGPRLIRLQSRRTLTIPFDAPHLLLNRFAMKAFNLAYYHRHGSTRIEDIVHYDPFFYPLDAIHQWNRLYGSRGFLQYQCVVPFDDEGRAIQELLQRVVRTGEASFLSVLKIFGAMRSPGMLSFPRPGITLALDLPNAGPSTLQLLEELDDIVRNSGGAVYPAKDARMSPDNFKAFFPQWEEFSRYVDPQFSSNLWRRVTRTMSSGQA